MSLDAKYVILANALWGEVAVIFPGFITHADVAFGSHVGPAIRAGFFCITPEGAQAYGESESLKLKSDGAADSRLLNRTLRLGRYGG